MNKQQILHACRRIIDSINQPGSPRGLQNLPKISYPENMEDFQEHLEKEHATSGFTLSPWEGYGVNYCVESEWRASLCEKLYEIDASWKDIHVVPFSYREYDGYLSKNKKIENTMWDPNHSAAIQDQELTGLHGMDLINKLCEIACLRRK